MTGLDCSPPSGDGISLLPIGEEWDVVRAFLAVDDHMMNEGITESFLIMAIEANYCAWLIPAGAAALRPYSFARLRRYVRVITDGYAAIPHEGRREGPGRTG